MGETQKTLMLVLQAFLPSADLFIFGDLDEKFLVLTISLFLAHKREEVLCIWTVKQILISSIKKYV